MPGAAQAISHARPAGTARRRAWRHRMAGCVVMSAPRDLGTNWVPRSRARLAIAGGPVSHSPAPRWG